MKREAVSKSEQAGDGFWAGGGRGVVMGMGEVGRRDKGGNGWGDGCVLGLCEWVSGVGGRCKAVSAL